METKRRARRGGSSATTILEGIYGRVEQRGKTEEKSEKLEFVTETITTKLCKCYLRKYIFCLAFLKLSMLFLCPKVDKPGMNWIRDSGVP